ncbi:hypothetical protein H1D32_11230 [Anaerobacillus sp. CMMVII]|uniref:hypothetical protein n=1 Tax=Anaerobacillus sp. CMMVII TaxID=2755588 RepID=UPI0021B7D2C9|nr:hypothetical protein [Anaerobacillus sp. CMMVII]MCT8138272.1 hypothetical protein [Anaerobacillus sp. CMMVII]
MKKGTIKWGRLFSYMLTFLSFYIVYQREFYLFEDLELEAIFAFTKEVAMQAMIITSIIFFADLFASFQKLKILAILLFLFAAAYLINLGYNVFQHELGDWTVLLATGLPRSYV